MHRLLSAWMVGLLLACAAVCRADEDLTRVTPRGELPADARLGKARDLYDKYHPWVPPASKEAWETEARKIRERILVSQGLWPMPPKTPLNAVIHGRIDRGDYTIEKVYFQSHPGHYVTGNLYRPKGGGKRPGVLCPHGHWPNGRFYDAGEKAAAEQIAQGAEKHLSGARYPLQARMVGLARLGCVVFHYDMIGYADSKGIEHRAGLTDTQAELWLQNHMGVQTWNSIRALDFLTGLEDVDADRIGVTGASGGGTQTFMLCAIDPRPACCFPAVMVSTDMQGGCVCENADYLRIGINNIALAALFAPKPMAMSGADDWTINIETKGLPELKQIYSLYGKANLVEAKTYKQFKHNYNQVAREMMYAWFNEHLKLGHQGPIEEKDFEPVPPKELSVWEDAHPVPADVKNAAQLREYLTEISKKQLEFLKGTLKESPDEYRKILGAAARAMLDDGVPSAESVESSIAMSKLESGLVVVKGTIGRKGSGEKVPFVLLVPEKPSGVVLVGVNPDKGIRGLLNGDKPGKDVQDILNAGHAIMGVDVFLTGEYIAEGKAVELSKVQQGYGGFTFGYNRPVLSNRVRDVLTAIAFARQRAGTKRVVLFARGQAVPWVLLARGLAGKAVDDAILNLSESSLTTPTSPQEANFLPGSLKYGGLAGLAASGAPAPMLLITDAEEDSEVMTLLRAAYAGAPESLTVTNRADPEQFLERLAK